MIFYQSLHWAVYNVSNRESETLGGLLYLFTEVYAYVADYMYGQPGTSVCHCVALKELLETLLEHSVYFGHVLVLAQEWCETGEPTVG